MQEASTKSAGSPVRTLRAAGWQAVLAALVLLAGMGGSAWMAVSRHRQDRVRVEQEFQLSADKVFGRTLREIQLFMEVLDSIRQLHSLSDQVSPEAFDEIVRKGMIYQQRILHAYGFAQSIPHGMREAYEQKNGAGRSILRSDGRGGFDPMPPRPVYYPLTYQTPPGGLGVPAGYDFSARPADQAAIASMVRHGVFALGGPPVGLGGGSGGLYMLAPIAYESGFGGRELIGFAIGLFQPRRILTAATGEGLPGVDARLEPAGEKQEEEIPEDEAWSFSRVFSLADQEWRFTARADPAYWARERSREPEAFAVIGAALSLGLSGALLWMAGRSRRIEGLVRRRTEELAESNRRLEAVMEERRELEDEVLRITGREKARIGRDLHDSLGQKLSGVMYLFGAYRQRAGQALETEAEQIASTLKEAVRQVRRIARGLAPVALTEDGLPDALRRLAEESSALFQKDVEFYAEREGRPRDAATAEHLYLIAQEALNNAVKHGGATRIVMTLDYDDRGGWLCMEDNGRGFPAERRPDREGGSGLRIMHHRAEVFGGGLSLDAGPQGGVRVVCRFPVAGDGA
ncbi:MAG: hypothetical protein GX548_09615 [Lentisphaerae bacterium]|nr:hypothetical protein [Lentisphaerota bacterium]